MSTPLYTIALRSTIRTESILQPGRNNGSRSVCHVDIADHVGVGKDPAAVMLDLSIFTSIDHDHAFSRFKRLVNDYQLDLEDLTSGEKSILTYHPSATPAGSEATEEGKQEVIRKLENRIVHP